MHAEIWDVFTRRPTDGNALAVVFDSEGIDDETRQRIAFEFGLSETVFVLRGDARAESSTDETDGVGGIDAQLKIFTPTQELAMAGHPTLGAAHALRRRLGQHESLRFLLGVGEVDVTFEGDVAWMDQGTPARLASTDRRAEVARALGLTTDDLHPALPIEAWSVGTPFLMVPLIDRRALQAARLDLRALVEHGGTSTHAVLAFVPASGNDPLRSRGFVEALGIVEDPGTGSAHGPLAGYLVRHGLLVIPPAAGRCTCLHLQGIEMGRRSEIHVQVADGQRGPRAWVGGAATCFVESARVVAHPRVQRASLAPDRRSNA